ncbi:MAG TPA: radical SAM protein, partial [Terriglobales bacterium]|nr:radical SAM protein [Terriglobales bacterium]
AFRQPAAKCVDALSPRHGKTVAMMRQPHDRPGEAAGEAGAHIVLLRPPAISSQHAYSTAIVPPLGPAYIAAALLAAGHRVDVIDALGEAPLARSAAAHPGQIAHGLTIDEIVERIPDDADGIGVSVMFSQQWPHTAAILRAIAAARPGVPIFAGGEHPSATWKYILEQHPEVTLCALGEGEQTAVDIAAWLAGHRGLDEIEGIAYRGGGEICRGPARQRLREVDALPRPAWQLFPLENYLANGFGHGVNRGRSLPMLATRGCPYRCTFCSSPDMWTTRYYPRAVSAVVDEIADYVERYQISNIDFEDLTMFVKRDWILEFCGEIERRGLKITFQLPSGTRSEALDRETLAALVRGGCRNLTYAPESGSRATLGEIKKRVDPDRLLDSMRVAKELGINIKANLMIGFPNETRRELLETLKLGVRAAWAGVDDIPLFPYSPYPGTSLYEDLRRDGILGPPDDDYFASLGYMDITRTESVCRHIGTTELNLYRIAGMAAFYAIGYLRHPSRLLRTARNVRAGRSDTVLEQRLVELRHRRVAALGRARRGPDVAALGRARRGPDVAALGRARLPGDIRSVPPPSTDGSYTDVAALGRARLPGDIVAARSPGKVR